MATKQEKAVQRALKKERKQNKIRVEKRLFWFLIALLLFLIYLLLAQHNGWWPYSRPNLGTAFYTNVSPTAAKSAPANPASSSSSGSQNGGSGTTATGGGTSSTTPSIANFSAGVNVGNSKEQINGQANGLGQNCAVVASATTSPGGQQEVCTYTQGDKIVTVTYLNDHVISASKSGF